MALIPPAVAAFTSRWTIALVAKCVATREDEHAVSVETQGPISPNVYDKRPTMYGGPLPMKACGGRE